MSCKICGRNSCASWMHSAEQQEAWSIVESMDDRQLRSEVVDLRGEVAALKAEISDEAIALRDMMSERDAAEAELAKAKAIIASIEEDGTEEHNAAVRLRQELAAERARLDWLELRGPWDSWNGFGETGITLRENIRAAIDGAMKEGSA